MLVKCASCAPVSVGPYHLLHRPFCHRFVQLGAALGNRRLTPLVRGIRRRNSLCLPALHIAFVCELNQNLCFSCSYISKRSQHDNSLVSYGTTNHLKFSIHYVNQCVYVFKRGYISSQVKHLFVNDRGLYLNIPHLKSLLVFCYSFRFV